MDEYKQYLAQKILTEDQVVTYRLLSRALKVHVNKAKEMLYDFHKWQNEKRPSSLHATYIVYGTKAKPNQRYEKIETAGSQDSDSEASDSESSKPQAPDIIGTPYSDTVPTYTLSLVSEEHLKETLSDYNKVTSIHVYSLSPHPVKDFQLLSDPASQVFELSKTDDGTPGSGIIYGTIANPKARKRTDRRPPVPSASVSKPIAKPESKPSAAITVKEDSKSGSLPASKPLAAPISAKRHIPSTASRRKATKGIGQMFADAAAKSKKPATKVSESPATSAVASGAEDSQKTGALSDDGEDDAEPIVNAKREGSSARQSRKDRQAELRRMMEESDEEKEEKEPEEVEEEPEPPKPEPAPKAEKPAEVVSSTSGGRRRGRRRVVRKKQVMDEKGYLVTYQETVWESFSEDEAPPPPKAKPVKVAPAAKSKRGAKGGAKGVPKEGQGNIMSFFSKK
ncbi:hypothetical protein GGS21DRAFT_503653 [Xylaria nigripes]|nr:hypothetical protein GGS21DRAFT_503653 [Xylaria nigripes]